MHYQELHQRYGSHVAKKVQAGMNASEFNQIALQDLLSYLELRAEAAHREYRAHVNNPFSDEKSGPGRAVVIDLLNRRWKSAEEISTLVATAEDVSAHLHIDMAAS